MDKETLITRAESWTLEKAQEFLNYMPGFKGWAVANKFWQREEDGGLTLISGASARYFHNDGTIKTITRNLHNLSYSNYASDFETLRNLYTVSIEQNKPIIAECKEIDYVTVNGEARKYTHWQSPADELGIPFVADLWTNADTIFETADMHKTWIDHVGWLIHAINDMGAAYPRRANFEHRLKNSQGYYFYDLQEFTCTYEDFYTRTTELVGRLATNNHTRIGVLPKDESTLDYANEIIAYAEQKWTL